jgi:hypothetical protein
VDGGRKLAFCSAPVFASYSLIAWLPFSLTTNRWLPDTATEIGVLKPVLIKVGLASVTVVALTVYLPTLFTPEFATKRVLPDKAIPPGPANPVIKLTLIAAPLVGAY